MSNHGKDGEINIHIEVTGGGNNYKVTFTDGKGGRVHGADQPKPPEPNHTVGCVDVATIYTGGSVCVWYGGRLYCS